MLTCPVCGHENPEGAKFCMECAAPLQVAAPPREFRKTVTVVFCDVTGSTALGERLDPESLRDLMARYFTEMSSVIERHGGTVEKFIGDAVMAIFGVPEVHEDDALRAVRAAADMQVALGALNKELERDRGTNLLCRLGVNTGEVVAGTGDQRIATGDTVNVAARLEQAAEPGTVLIGQDTFRLVRDAVEVEPVAPLELKGKSEPVPAFRLLHVTPGAAGHVRRMDSPMVGRFRELDLLRQAFERAVTDDTSVLFTVLAPAGAGKSRLVEEFLADAGGGDPAMVLRGRCLPYGEGITYYPVLEAVKQAAGLADFDAPEIVHEKVCTVLEGDEHGDVVCGRIAQLLGVADEGAGEETFWAIRRFFEAVARHQPVVLVFDDIHWGEATFLDLIEHLADWSRGVPILLLCMARPELLDARGSWGGGKLNATTISLEPLSSRECEELIVNLLGDADVPRAVEERIMLAAEGNPLFVEEMLAMLVDDGLLAHEDGRWTASRDLTDVAVPPTIQALLGARLDRLHPAEREVLEAAAVIGKEFFLDAVRVLAAEHLQGEVPQRVMSLVRKELVRPESSSLPGEDAFVFRHLLIRDAAYGSMPKMARAEMHERCADWLEGIAGGRAAEQEEIIGYHLEQAYRLRAELGPPDERANRLAGRAADLLEQAGSRARLRGDLPATVNLLARATELRPLGRERTGVLIDLAFVSLDAGEYERMEDAVRRATADAELLGDPALIARADVARAWVMSVRDPFASLDWSAVVPRAIEVLEPIGDDRALMEAWTLKAWDMGGNSSRFAEGIEAAKTARTHAQLAGDQLGSMRTMLMGTGWLVWGPAPVSAALEECEAVLEEVTGNRYALAELAGHRACLEAMRGRFEEGRALHATALETFVDLGQVLAQAFEGQHGWLVEWLASDYAAAEAAMRRAVEILEARDDRGLVVLNRAMMAEAIVAQRKIAEADELAAVIARDVHPSDVTTLPVLRRVQALVAASRGDLDAADVFSLEAISVVELSDDLFDTSLAWITRAAVLREMGRNEEAAAALDRAIALSDRKEDQATASRARALRQEIQP
jgi:class 3 adenylate cyclase/tetratricopeptide (TPR) repeat protein